MKYLSGMKEDSSVDILCPMALREHAVHSRLFDFPSNRNMYGNQLVTSTTIWTVGFVIGQVPSNLLLTRVPPHLVMPALRFLLRLYYTQTLRRVNSKLELAWGIATLGSCAVKNYKALYALRFLVSPPDPLLPLLHYPALKGAPRWDSLNLDSTRGMYIFASWLMNLHLYTRSKHALPLELLVHTARAQ